MDNALHTTTVPVAMAMLSDPTNPTVVALASNTIPSAVSVLLEMELMVHLVNIDDEHRLTERKFKARDALLTATKTARTRYKILGTSLLHQQRATIHQTGKA
jgi:hypothetical protein